jgi:hypothetical protein
MSQSHWRRIAAPIIAEVISAVGDEDTKALRSALLAAYPFGQKKYHPYKIWLSEIRRQLGKETTPGWRHKPAKNARKLFETEATE